MKSYEAVYAAADLFIILGAVSPLIGVYFFMRKKRLCRYPPSFWVIFPAMSLICALLHNFADELGVRVEAAQYDLDGDGKGSFEEILLSTDGRPMTPDESHALALFTGELGRNLNQIAIAIIAPAYSAGVLALSLLLIWMTQRAKGRSESHVHSSDIATPKKEGKP